MGRGRAPCCDKAGLKKGPWTHAEDLTLIAFIQKHGHGNWRALPKLAGLLRCGKSCRLRWTNYLRPDIKRGSFTKEEEDTIIELHKLLGNKWSKIASKFPGRTDNEIKNVWNTHLKKRLALKGENPFGNEHKEVSTTTSSSSSSSSLSYCTNGRNLSESESPIESLEKNQGSLVEAIPIQWIEKHEPKELLRSSITSPLLHPNLVNGSRLEEQTCLTVDSGELSEVQDSLQDVVKQDIPEEILEIPYEFNLDLWDMLENDTSFSTNSPVPLMYENEVHQHSNIVEENLEAKDLESMSWVTELENELGLQETSCDADELFLSTSSSEEMLVKADNDPIQTYFQMWPSSPLNFNL